MIKRILLFSALALLCHWPATVSAQLVQGITPFLNASNLQEVAAGDNGVLWFASNGGALRFDTTSEQWSVFPRRSVGGPVGNDLVTVAVDESGLVWTGSGSRGVSTYDQATDRWEEFIEIPSASVKVIRTAGSAVYIGTQSGLALRVRANRTDICNEIDTSCIVPSFDVNDYAVLDGELWVATTEGLGKFDGEFWVESTELPDGSVGQASLSLVTFNNQLWEAIPGQVRVLDNGTWTDTNVNASKLVVTDGSLFAYTENQLWEYVNSAWVERSVVLSGQSPAIRDLERVGDNLFLATDLGLLRVINYRNNSVGELSVPPGPQIPDFHRGMAITPDGTVWAGNTEGVLSYDGDSWSVFAKGENGLDREWVFAMIAAQNDVVVGHCCCDNPPRCRVDVRRDGAFLNLDVYDIWAMALDPQGRLWLGTNNTGVVVLEQDGSGVWNVIREITNSNTNGALRSNSVRALAVTRDGTYFGHTTVVGVDFWPHGGDITQFNDLTWSAISIASGLLDGNIAAMATQDLDVFVGSSSGLHRVRNGQVLNRWETTTGEVGDLPRIVRAITVDRLGGVWAGTNDGLFYLESRNADLRLFNTVNSDLTSNDVFSSALHPIDGSVWLGTAEGITRVNPVEVGGRQTGEDTYVLYPNPFRAEDGHVRVTLAFSARGAAPTAAGDMIEEARILDLTGREVGEFRRQNTEWLWNIVNTQGDLVVPGMYVVRCVTSSGEVINLKLGILR
ncbi:MAG: hypothetical protein HKN21_08140 [Candidatus Eisenbacteria bacterium]|uniref:T9SS type A sorting domain-containing protein n=1 Tax=Eiseniibacteriota bacterium TaxID=2212470 RepID=A0A7Y2E8R7_UNCEI|nr:hypothetical protein [Candidatus Eisenbacteria bacterium]